MCYFPLLHNLHLPPIKRKFLHKMSVSFQPFNVTVLLRKGVKEV